MKDKLIIKGAREHNLKNINLTLPKNKLIVFSGISGSGKSSLAYDTIYAEGQRRYVESLSSYARQFLGVMSKPNVDSIEGLSPAISIDQKSATHNPRSTVGTVTEIYDYLRLLYARVGHPHCPNCGKEISQQSPQQIIDQVFEKILKRTKISSTPFKRFIIFSPIIRDRKGEFKQLFDSLKAKGFSHVRIDGHLVSLDEHFYLIKTNKHTIELLCDRITAQKKSIKDRESLNKLNRRITEAIEQALTLSEGLVIISEIGDSSFEFPEKPKKMKDSLYSQIFACPECNISIAEIEPRMFSFNSPHGACPRCSGIGTLLKADENLLLNLNLSITEGGILPFARAILSDTWLGRIIITAAEAIAINPSLPLKQAKPVQLRDLLYGTEDRIYQVVGENRYGKEVAIYEKFRGIVAELESRFVKTESENVRRELNKYMKEEICLECKGARLKKQALSVTINGKNIAQVTSLSIKQAACFIEEAQTKFSQREKKIAELIVKEVSTRLTFLLAVGLSYLTLSRNANTLAGGEAQRIRLASQIGSSLSGVLYVLDEPSIGLHPRDNHKLITTLKKLRNLGNTVLVVEHDREIMEQADLIADFGPAAGEGGGRIVALGTPAQIKAKKGNLTGEYLAGKRKIKIYTRNNKNKTNNHVLTIKGCRQNNLKNIDVSFPLNKLICLTGVSGSGKSSLVVDTLYKGLKRYFNPYFRETVGLHRQVNGANYLDRVLLIDQSPIGRTPRSNPATYTQAFTYIRELFSQTSQARVRGYKKGRFSFNVAGGRCEACKGEGQTKIEMQFLADVYVSCDVCSGKRYNNETLKVRYKDKNIAQVLEMTVEEAFDFFKNIPGLYTILETLNSVGLSYMQLGQGAPSLSGGEAQRVKIAAELSKRSRKNTLYILDEPTTGLHFADLEKLLTVLRTLVDIGNTVIVIEHNLDVVKNADWIIDLGPEGGDCGGKIVAEGPVEKLILEKSSYTGKFLKKHLSGRM